jgi:uroporphyrinogen-III synthase
LDIRVLTSIQISTRIILDELEENMANKKFNEDEMNHLRASSYVLDVSPSAVHFSVEFKKKFWEAILAGKKPRDIVIELGIDPDILGENRTN